MLAELLASIRSLLRIWVDRALEDASDAARAIEEHAAIFAAVQTRDTDAATAAMGAHMQTAALRLLAGYDAAQESGDSSPNPH